MKIRRASTTLVSAATLAVGTFAFAQSPPEPPPTSASPTTSSVVVTSATVTSTGGRSHLVTLGIQNRSTVVQRGLRIHVELRRAIPPGAPAEGAPAEGSTIIPDSLTLGPGEIRTVSFSYEAPPTLPESAYRLQARILANDGQELSTYELPAFHLGTSSTGTSPAVSPGARSPASAGFGAGSSSRPTVAHFALLGFLLLLLAALLVYRTRMKGRRWGSRRGVAILLVGAVTASALLTAVPARAQVSWPTPDETYRQDSYNYYGWTHAYDRYWPYKQLDTVSTLSSSLYQELQGQPDQHPHIVRAPNLLYVAAIGIYPDNISVVSVSGLGLTWSRVDAQCSTRRQNRTEVWQARSGSVAPLSGTPYVIATLTGPVTGTALIHVTPYRYTHTATPIGAAASANTIGTEGPCPGAGTDTSAYDFLLPSTPGKRVAGTFRRGTSLDSPLAPVDWSVVALELRPSLPTGRSRAYWAGSNDQGAQVEHFWPEWGTQVAQIMDSSIDVPGGTRLKVIQEETDAPSSSPSPSPPLACPATVTIKSATLPSRRSGTTSV